MNSDKNHLAEKAFDIRSPHTERKDAAEKADHHSTGGGEDQFKRVFDLFPDTRQHGRTFGGSTRSGKRVVRFPLYAFRQLGPDAATMSDFRRWRATILGSGTSTGVPPIGCHEPVCLSDDPKNKRLRSGLLIREQGDIASARAFIVDCGPDYRQQALTHRIDRLDGVILTHAHYDHVGGIDDLRLYNFRQKHSLPMYGQPAVLTDIRKRFDYIFNPPSEGGGVASLDLIEVDGPFEFLGLRIVPIPVMHGSLPILGYRFGDFVYITDASAISSESMDLIGGCRVLILNVLRQKKHSTHFNLDEAVAVATKVSAEQTYFVHMTHHLEHHETNAMLPSGMELAWDGLEFDILPESVKTSADLTDLAH